MSGANRPKDPSYTAFRELREQAGEPLMESSRERGYTAAYASGSGPKQVGAPADVRAKADWRTPENAYVPEGRNMRNVWLLPDQRVRLRADLTPEQRAHVMDRLAAQMRRGLP